MFVSSISCNIDPALYKTSISYSIHPVLYKSISGKGESPSPFVCFISTPPEAVQKERTSWDLLKEKFKISTMMTTKAKGDGSIYRTNLGWPRTRKINYTYQPRWQKDDEVHFVVRTHLDDGLPIDLTGAMLHIAVYDGSVKGSDPRLIGTFSLNLAWFIERSRQSNMEPSSRITSPTRNDFQSSSTLSTSPSMSNPPSLKMLFHASMFASAARRRNRDSIQEEQSGDDGVHEERDGHQGTKTTLNQGDEEEHVGEVTSGPSPSFQAAMNAHLFASKARKKAQAALFESLKHAPHDPHSPPIRPANSSEDYSPSKNDDGSSRPSPSPGLGAFFASNMPEKAAENKATLGAVNHDRTTPTDDRSTMTPMSVETAKKMSGFASKLRARTKKKMAQRNVTANDDMESLNIRSLRIDEPLIKNGREVGRIQCTIDSWWLNEEAAMDRKRQSRGKKDETEPPAPVYGARREPSARTQTPFATVDDYVDPARPKSLKKMKVNRPKP